MNVQHKNSLNNQDNYYKEMTLDDVQSETNAIVKSLSVSDAFNRFNNDNYYLQLKNRNWTHTRIFITNIYEILLYITEILIGGDGHFISDRQYLNRHEYEILPKRIRRLFVKNGDFLEKYAFYKDFEAGHKKISVKKIDKKQLLNILDKLISESASLCFDYKKSKFKETNDVLMKIDDIKKRLLSLISIIKISNCIDNQIYERQEYEQLKQRTNVVFRTQKYYGGYINTAQNAIKQYESTIEKHKAKIATAYKDMHDNMKSFFQKTKLY